MDLRELIGSQPDVASILSKHLLLTEAKSSNTVLSPLSIHVILSLIAAGSKGPTQAQLLSFLKAKSGDHLNAFSSELISVVFADGTAAGGPTLSLANGVWVDKSISLNHTFKQLVDNVYKAASDQVDFQSKAAEVANEVNTWAEKKTNGIIKEVLPSGAVDNTTRLVFANALYFKGAWNDKFDASATKDHDFHLLSGSSVRVPFMTSKKKQFVSQSDGFKVLSLPYKQGEDKRKFSMNIFLPDSKDGLPALVEKFGSEPGFLNRHVPQQRAEVGDFKIPRFKISYGFEASNTLKGLGLLLPFSNEADLTEMVDASAGGSNLSVSSVFHKSFIEVNEEGTEAGAASVGVIALRSLRIPEKIDFVADHPFLFVIREDLTGVVLFSGHILDPSQAS
ncbi:At1g47710 [Linum grandiflorum]